MGGALIVNLCYGLRFCDLNKNPSSFMQDWEKSCGLVLRICGCENLCRLNYEDLLDL